MAKFDPSQVTWYQRSRGTTVAGPSVSINKTGKVVLSQQAMELIGNPDALQVGVISGSRGKTTLVLQAASRGDAGSLAVGKQGKSKFSISSTKFLRDVGLEKHFGTMENTPELDEESDTLLVSLS